MIRTFARRLSAGIALATQTLLIMGACLCPPAPAEEAAVSGPKPPCHQTETGPGISASDACCCDQNGAAPPEALARIEVAAIHAPLLSTIPAAAASPRPDPPPAPSLPAPLRPRPPLRV